MVIGITDGGIVPLVKNSSNLLGHVDDRPAFHQRVVEFWVYWKRVWDSIKVLRTHHHFLWRTKGSLDDGRQYCHCESRPQGGVKSLEDDVSIAFSGTCIE